jgi:hypothetical protein
MKNKKDILIKLGIAAGILLIFNSFRNKPKTKAGVPLIEQIDAPTGSKQVFSKVGTRLFDKNKQTVMTFTEAGFGMTVTGYNNGVYSVVYGDTFYNGLPAYVNDTDVTAYSDSASKYDEIYV